MQPTGALVRTIPYHQEGEPEKHAAILRVSFKLDGLSQDEIQVLGHLIEATDALNPIFRDQVEPRTFVLRRLIGRLMTVGTEDERQKLEAYRAVLDLHNMPFATLPRKNNLLDLPEHTVRALASSAGEDAWRDYEAVHGLLFAGQALPDRANFYPADLSEDEFTDLGSEATRVNSSVIRLPDGRPQVILNEIRYREALQPALAHLRSARDYAHSIGLRAYLDAKIVEMESGSAEARRVADYVWFHNDSPIDVVISTALEVYLDNFRNARGSATGGVYRTDRRLEKLLASIVERVPRLEAEAPWTFKKEDVRLDRLPRLKYVDVLAWSGDYVTGPGAVLAQSLPNDEWVRQHVGSVNMVYVNTTHALHDTGGLLPSAEFLLRAEDDRVRDVLFDAYQLSSALHEIGHSCGRMDPDHSTGQPTDYLQEEYSTIEELRAELFALWSLEILVDEGLVDETTAQAAYDSMLLALLRSLKFDPVQAHNKARNLMFHRFERDGVLGRVEEGERTRFIFQRQEARSAVSRLLKQVADLRAAGDKAEATKLRRELVFPDPLKPEIEARMAQFPVGAGFLFPRLKSQDGRYLPELVYPDAFSDQAKFNLELPQT
jgi:hypothetical protein